MNEGQEVLNLVATSNAVEKNSVVVSTRENYENKLVQIILWLYKNHQGVLSHTCKAAIERTSQTRNRSSRNKEQRRALKAMLNKLSRKDSSTSPITLEAEDDDTEILSYDHIVEYFGTKQKIEKVEASLAEKFHKKLRDMGGIGENNENDNDDSTAFEPDENGQVAVAIRLEATSYEGYRSALAFLYNQTGVAMPKTMADNFSLYIKGSKRINLAAKQTLGLKIVEGKKHMTPDVYSKLAQVLFESDKVEHIFAHTFLVLDWNLMKRAENCVNANISHIQVVNDALVFEFAKSKSSQDGEEHLGPWHVYANPLQPHICPKLALARYLFMFSSTFTGRKTLFEGNDQYNRYTKIFSDVVMDNIDELRKMGVDSFDLGTHSARKGVATLVASGCTISPPIISICLRMGWSMGGVKDRYLKLAEAGDQAVGRRANLSDPLKKEYAISQPYFDFTDIEDASTRQSKKNEIHKFINDRLTGAVTTQARNLAYHLFASICYHYDYLCDHLHQNCPFRRSPFFVDLPDSFRRLVRTAYPWTSTSYTPKFTGIPPHVSLLAAMEEVQRELKELRESLPTTIANELNERGVGSSQYFTDRIEKQIAAMAKRMEDQNKSLMDQLKNYSQHSASNSSDEDILYDVVEETAGEDHVELVVEGNDTADVRHEQENRKREDAVNTMKKRRVTLGCINGKLTKLPPGFKFPQMTCEQLVRNWFTGDNKNHVVPFRRLNAVDVDHVKNGKGQRQKMERFMKVIEKYAKIEGCWFDDGWDQNKVTTMWSAISHKHIFPKYCKSNQRSVRLETGSWFTMLTKMCKAGAFKKTRNDCRDDAEWTRSVHNTLVATTTTTATTTATVTATATAAPATVTVTANATATATAAVTEIGGGGGATENANNNSND